MKIEDYFEDSSQVMLDFNGDQHSLDEYKKIKKNKFRILNTKELIKYIDVKLIYSNELAGSIEGYILDCNEYQKYLDMQMLNKDNEYINDTYWEIDSKWEDLATFFKIAIDEDFYLGHIYFVIKNLNIESNFKDNGVEIFFINEIKDIIKKYINVNIDYLIVIRDTSKFKLSSEELNLRVGEKIKFSFFKNIKKINYMNKQKVNQNIVNIAQKTNFEILNTKDKNIELWIK